MSPPDPPHPVKRALLIVNPGARRATRARAEAARALERAGVEYEVITTVAPGHGADVMRERGARFDVVFTLGGDGTAIEVITALAGGGPPVGILAGGTGNVLARSLGIPLLVSRAIPRLLAGTETRIDLGQLADGRQFAIGLGVGLDAAMIAGASAAFKRRLGVLAYVWAATRAALRVEKFRVHLTVDGVLHERSASSVMIANLGSVLGGAITFGQGIASDDGVLHACVYAPANLREAMRMFARMLRGRVHLDAGFSTFPGRHFLLETDPPRAAQADGELLGMTPLDVTVRPGAARLLVPARPGVSGVSG
ncbi:MAG: diacylglycerol kinase family protein [Gemmatimonadaceae bacterium]